MNRAFVSLYLLIVTSVLAIGWATERVWQAYSTDTHTVVVSPEREELINTLLFTLKDKRPDEIQARLSQLAGVIESRLFYISWDDFAESDIKERLRLGELVVINSEENERRYFALAENKQWVLTLVERRQTEADSWVYRLLLMAFYLLIALSIYLWILPLTRDLKLLQQRAEGVGRDGELVELTLKPSSAVYSLARTFNSMAARIRELLASQKEMTHGISHELRTPLARMKFTLASIDKNDRHHAAWQTIDENIKELETLITQFLNYASYEANNKNVQYREGELLPMLQRIVEHANFSLEVKFDDGLSSSTVMCDWDMIEHCVKNLMQNANRYGHKKMLVQLKETASTYEIHVHDDGPGIAEEDSVRIFEAFYRSSKHSTSALRAGPQAGATSNAGFGLGLALVKRIITWHHGYVRLQRSSLGGACFVLAWKKRSA